MVGEGREGVGKGVGWGHLLCRADSATGQAGELGQTDTTANVGSVELSVVYRPHQGVSDPPRHTDCGVVEQPRDGGGGSPGWWWWWGRGVRFSELGFDVL